MSAHSFWSWRGLTLTLTASALWGLAPVVTKGALAGFSPEIIAICRLGIAAVLCRSLAGREHPWLIRDPWLHVAGVALGADFVLYNYGLQRTTAGVAGLLVNVETLTTIGLARWLLGERLDARRLIGCLITLTGAIYLSLAGSEIDSRLADGRIVGNFLVMASAMCWSVYAVSQRRCRTPANLFARLASVFLVAAITVAPTCLHSGAWRVDADAHAWAMLLVLAVLCTFAVYRIYAHAQQLIDVSILAALFCTIPVFSVVFANVLLGEPITAQLVAGGVVVIGGIAVVASSSTR